MTQWDFTDTKNISGTITPKNDAPEITDENAKFSLKESEVLKDLENLKKAILVMHSPTDDTVSIQHAAKIFMASKHPKSFVSLDTADHLLSNRKEAEYAASVIGAWVSRYIGFSP